MQVEMNIIEQLLMKDQSPLLKAKIVKESRLLSPNKALIYSSLCSAAVMLCNKKPLSVSLREWYKKSYEQLPIKEEWLNNALEYSLTENDSFLHSYLSTVVPSTTFGQTMLYILKREYKKLISLLADTDALLCALLVTCFDERGDDYEQLKRCALSSLAASLLSEKCVSGCYVLYLSGSELSSVINALLLYCCPSKHNAKESLELCLRIKEPLLHHEVLSRLETLTLEIEELRIASSLSVRFLKPYLMQCALQLCDDDGPYSSVVELITVLFLRDEVIPTSGLIVEALRVARKELLEVLYECRERATSGSRLFMLLYVLTFTEKEEAVCLKEYCFRILGTRVDFERDSATVHIM